MSTASVTPNLVDTIDTLYEHVKGNVLQINSQRQFGGIVQSRDWPPKPLIYAAPYLIILKEAPLKIKHQSFYAPLMAYPLEWRWQVQGDNIPQNAQAANRGDKYRINMQIIQELISAHNPGYDDIKQYSVGPDDNNNPVQIVTTFDPPEQLWWSMPVFSAKIDRTTGALYETGYLEVNSFAPVSMNLN